MFWSVENVGVCSPVLHPRHESAHAFTMVRPISICLRPAALEKQAGAAAAAQLIKDQNGRGMENKKLPLICQVCRGLIIILQIYLFTVCFQISG